MKKFIRKILYKTDHDTNNISKDIFISEYVYIDTMTPKDNINNTSIIMDNDVCVESVMLEKKIISDSIDALEKTNKSKEIKLLKSTTSTTSKTKTE